MKKTRPQIVQIARVTPGKTDKTGHPDSLYGGMLDTVSCRALFDAA